MSLLDTIFPVANAQVTGAAAAGPGLSGLLIWVPLIVIMYFLMFRPQMKRAKEHKAMLGKLSRGDEVLTTGGLAGVVSEIGDNFISVEIADGVRVRMQRTAIANILPKGTLKAA